MSRFKARATTPDEQLAQSAERAGGMAAAADERATTAIQAADDETQRIRKLQAGFGIIRFEDQPAAVANSPGAEQQAREARRRNRPARHRAIPGDRHEQGPLE